MKKIDLMLKVLFVMAFANVSFSQVGFYPGGPTCEESVDIAPGTGYITNATPVSDWYRFTAPCDGDLNVTICPYGDNKQRRIWSGVCGSLVLESTATWNQCANPPVPMLEDEVVYIEMDDTWDSDDVIFDIGFENPACPQPTSLDGFATSYDEALIGWFAGGPETNWTVVYGPTGFDPEAGGTTITVSGSPATTLTGLTELTCYDYYVEANCGGGLSSCFMSGPYTFCTPAICPKPVSPNETGITNVEATVNWTEDGSADEWEVQWGDEGFLLGDGTMDLGLTSETDLLTGLTPDDCYDWYVRAVCEVDLGAGLETVYSLWVGPQEFCTDKNCLDPSDLDVISAPGITATTTWTENNTPAATEWNIQYGDPGFSLGTGTTITNVPTNPYTITGLMAGTEYCYYVQSVCGVGDSTSNWVGPFCFTTGIFCNEPIDLTVSTPSSTEADLEWAAGGTEDSWTVIWGEDGFDPTTGGTTEVVDIFPALGLSGLTPGQTYCYYVAANCGETADSMSFLAGPVCWTQPPLCTAPFAGEIINITNTAANVTFTSPAAEEWDLIWGLPCFDPLGGEEVGSVEGTEDYPYYITGLEGSTPYEVYVRAICGTDSISAWTKLSFGTDISNDNPCTAETLVLDADPLFRHNYEATILPGEAALAPDPAGCFDTDGWCSGEGVDRTVWFKFVAPPSGQVNVSTFSSDTCKTNSYTEIAMYTTGDCGLIENFDLVAANSLAAEALEPPFGSSLTVCTLDPGVTYYVMVNPISFIEAEVTFEISLNSVEDLSEALGLSPTICAGTEYDLFNSIAGFTEGGQWYNPSVAPGNELGNLVSFPDAAGSFNLFYVATNGCDADTVMSVITTEENVDAGGDGFYTACNTYDIILGEHIMGVFEGGGIWEYTGEDTTVALAGGLFTPLGMTPGTYEFIYTVSNEYCPTDTSVVTVTLTDCLGLEDEELTSLEVYPNPVSDVLTVQNLSIDGNATIEVLDIEGRVIYADQVSNLIGNYTIDMSDVERGVYFVRLTGQDAVQKVRVVKQ